MILWCTYRKAMGSGGSAIEVFSNTVQNHPDKEALVFTKTNKSYTYKEMDSEINKAANWMLSNNVKSGDIVALMMENCPEFIIFWMAALKIGATVACINTTLKQRSLIQSIQASSSSALIFQRKFRHEVSLITKSVDSTIQYYECDDGVANDSANVEMPMFFRQADFSELADSPPDYSFIMNVTVDDVALLIYTSGTTGNPKPVVVTQAKLCGGSVFMNLAGVTSADRIYCSLPLYHTSAALLGWGTCMSRGSTFILADKFSKSRFLTDCITHNVTVIQYIGELCRFLLSTPPSSIDRTHSIRLAYGNGLRPDVWKKFVDRFCIDQVFEFYGSTEGNSTMYNFWTKGNPGLGAVGKLTRATEWLQGVTIVKCGDEDDGAEGPWRDPVTGFCRKCDVGQVGELVSKIDDASLTKAFKGYYKDREGSEKKVLGNVFDKGDRYFRTGDTMRLDADGFMYFSDRIGDTFRWKGENVSTQQVAEIMHDFPGIVEANVVGVRVPGEDGRAGLAVVSIDTDAFRVEELGDFLLQNLPRFAVPIWIRVLKEVGMEDSHTGTFKQKKVEFRNQVIFKT
ncbi:Fatty-acid-CoA ligase FadD6 [Podochytrium sp. JEL0797]|nr:Fatty-acid-CoA ligase FadD6 [Podochytrium sp. JEL0797]